MTYYIAHHGIKGQKWGRRRYQNEDGSYKPGAEGRYSAVKETAKAVRDILKPHVMEDGAKSSGKPKWQNNKTPEELRKEHKTIINKVRGTVGDFRSYKDAKKMRNEVNQRMSEARSKATADKQYKKTSEYKAARAAKRKQTMSDLFYGKKGTNRIYQSMALGTPEQKARRQEYGRKMLTNALVATGTLAAGTAVMGIKKKYGF